MSQQNDDDLSEVSDLPALIPEYVPQNAVYTKDELDSHIAAFAEHHEQIANLKIDIDLLDCQCQTVCDCAYDINKCSELLNALKTAINCVESDCPGHMFNEKHSCLICRTYDTNYIDWLVG